MKKAVKHHRAAAKRRTRSFRKRSGGVGGLLESDGDDEEFVGRGDDTGGAGVGATPPRPMPPHLSLGRADSDLSTISEDLLRIYPEGGSNSFSGPLTRSTHSRPGSFNSGAGGSGHSLVPRPQISVGDSTAHGGRHWRDISVTRSSFSSAGSQPPGIRSVGVQTDISAVAVPFNPLSAAPLPAQSGGSAGVRLPTVGEEGASPPASVQEASGSVITIGSGSATTASRASPGAGAGGEAAASPLVAALEQGLERIATGLQQQLSVQLQGIRDDHALLRAEVATLRGSSAGGSPWAERASSSGAAGAAVAAGAASAGGGAELSQGDRAHTTADVIGSPPAAPYVVRGPSPYRRRPHAGGMPSPGSTPHGSPVPSPGLRGDRAGYGGETDRQRAARLAAENRELRRQVRILSERAAAEPPFREAGPSLLTPVSVTMEAQGHADQGARATSPRSLRSAHGGRPSSVASAPFLRMEVVRTRRHVHKRAGT